jgi:hypothetical protein
MNDCAMSPLQPSTSSIGVDVPTLIVLCTWTGAQEKYIDKYKDGYRQLFPDVEVKVLKTCLWDLCFRDSQSKQKALEADVDEIDLLCKDNGRVLLHVFSDGGSNKACELADAYLHNKRRKLPIAALYLDSTPGTPRFAPLCKAASKSFPPDSLLGFAALAMSAAIVAAIWIYYCIVGFDRNIITMTRRRLLSKQIWDLKVPRCHLYSRADEEIHWEDVQSHARDSMVQGAPITEVLFQRTKHVKHASLKPERLIYWRVIHETWKYANLGSKTKGELSSAPGGRYEDFTIIAHRTSSEKGEVCYMYLIRSMDRSECVWKSERNLAKGELKRYWDGWRRTPKADVLPRLMHL